MEVTVLGLDTDNIGLLPMSGPCLPFHLSTKAKTKINAARELTKTKTSRYQYFLIHFFIDQSLSFVHYLKEDVSCWNLSSWEIDPSMAVNGVSEVFEPRSHQDSESGGGSSRQDGWAGHTLVTEFSKEAQFGKILSQMEDFCIFILPNNNIPESLNKSIISFETILKL